MGVFPPRRSRRRLKPCLPHARGGVSQAWIWPAIAFRSSPRSWGCFLSDSRRSCSVSVFPTLVGVFLGSMSSSARPMRLPHARGGVSGDQATEPPSQKSSPRSWGCFREIYGTRNDGRVFPTLVGVFPFWRPSSTSPLGVFPTLVGVFLESSGRSGPSSSLPHARGGVSIGIFDAINLVVSSPRSWGCFYGARHLRA